MNRVIRTFFVITLALLMSFSSGAAALATAPGNATPAGTDETAATAAEAGESQSGTGEDSGIIDAAELQQWMDQFAQENDLKQDYKRFSVGFWYSGTGDSWYYDADQWMYSASLYKVPVSMLMAEKEAAGELTPASVVNGTTLEYLESTALVYSNNDSGHSMVSWLGGTYAGKCSDMTIKFTDLPESYFNQDFYDVSYYTARYMTQVMSTLYQGGEEKFPHLADYLKQAQPNDYFNKDSTLKANYAIAQKFGAYEEPNGNNNNHCSAIIYTPNPIVVTVMTRNVGDYQNIIASVGAHLAELALRLDGELEEYKKAEAEQAAAAQRAAEEAAAAAELNATGTENAEPDSVAVPAVTGGSSTEPSPTTAEADAKVKPGGNGSALKGIPTLLYVAGGILILAILVIAVLLFLQKRGAGGENEDGEDWRDPDAMESTEGTPRQSPRRETGDRKPAEKTVIPAAVRKKRQTQEEYRPRH